MTRWGSIVTIAMCVLIAAGCGRAAEPPEPRVEGTEPLVAERIREATGAVRSDPTAAAWGRLGQIYDIHRIAEPALASYAEAERLAPDDWRWPYFSGIVLRESDRSGSVAAFERAARLEPSYAPLHVYLGLAFLAAEEFDRAAASFDAALAMDPTSANARIGLARVALARGDAALARDRLLEAARGASNEAAVHHHLAQAFQVLGDERRADRERRLAESAAVPLQVGGLASFPDPVRDDVILAEGASLSWLIANAQRLVARGQRDEAAATIERALAAAPESGTALLVGGRVYAELGQAERAFALVERAIALAPEDAAGYVEIGHLFVRAGQGARAIQAFEKALALDPRLPAVRSNLATLYFQSGRTAEGVELLRVARRELPADLDIQYNLAATLVMTGETIEAREVLTEALDIAPGHVPSRYLLGVAQATDERFAEAAAVFAEVIERDPTHLEARLDLGRALWRLDRWAEAIGAFREAARQAPGNVEAAREVAWSLAVCPQDGLRNGREALEIARALAEQGGARDPSFLDLLAAAQAETGDFRGAIETGDRAVRMVQRALLADRDPPPAAQAVMMRDFLAELVARVDGYRRGRPYRDRG